MLLQHLGQDVAARRLDAAIERVLLYGPFPADLGGQATTQQVADAVLARRGGPRLSAGLAGRRSFLLIKQLITLNPILPSHHVLHRVFMSNSVLYLARHATPDWFVKKFPTIRLQVRRWCRRENRKRPS